MKELQFTTKTDFLSLLEMFLYFPKISASLSMFNVNQLNRVKTGKIRKLSLLVTFRRSRKTKDSALGYPTEAKFPFVKPSGAKVRVSSLEGLFLN